MRRKDREVSDPAEVLSILQKADVCRLAMCDNNVPYVVTMNFGIGKGGAKTLYFHCANAGKKLEILKKNNLVCFQTDVDHEFFLHEVNCGCSMRYRSVVGMGRVQILTDVAEKLEGLRALMEHYTHKEEHTFKPEMVERTTILRLDIDEVSAKALVKPGHLT